jgi:pyruvate/2-oxoglutarate dehydrogenase complex dihydrolipoamide acyltransferase (E2) component
MKTNNDYITKTFPSSRQFTLDIGKIGMRKHHIKALIEIDVTDSRIKIKNRRKESSNRISFTSWVLMCIGQAVNEHKQVHALRSGKNRLVIFNEIDISILVEKKVNDDLVPIPLVIRNITKKNITDITAEIEIAKNEVINDGQKYVIEKNRRNEPIKLFSLFPQFLRLFIWRLLLSNPQRVKKMMGTVVVTSIGMIGKLNGFLIPFSIHPVCFAIGSIVKKPGIINNNIDIREFLEMTILIDHDVIDGAPAARFVARLSELIEKGYNL